MTLIAVVAPTPVAAQMPQIINSNTAHVGHIVENNNLSAEIWRGLPRVEDIAITMPQAPGVVQVTGTASNGSPLVYFAFSPKNAITIAARIVAPNGDSISLAPFEFQGCPNCGDQASVLELWNGRFPWTWQAGTTTFQVFVIANGRVSLATGTVSLWTNDFPAFGITDIGQSSTNGQVSFKLTLGTINKKSSFYGLLGSSILLPPSSFKIAADGKLNVAIPARSWIPPGTNSLTICRDGACRTITVDSMPSATVVGGPKG